jgi:hypothetical protein
VDWVNLAQDRNQNGVSLNTALNLQVSLRTDIFMELNYYQLLIISSAPFGSSIF